MKAFDTDAESAGEKCTKMIQKLVNSVLNNIGLELRRRQDAPAARPAVSLPVLVKQVQDMIADFCPNTNYAGYYRNFEYAYWSSLLPVLWNMSNEARTGRVLDIGCGYGTLLAVFRELGWEVHGTDMLPVTELMGLRTQEYFNIAFRESNIEIADLPYKDEEFDIVVMSEIIEHFHFQPLTSLRRAFRLLKPGGFLFVTTPALSFGWDEEEYAQPFEYIPMYRADTRVINPHKHMKIYAPEEFCRLVGALGGRSVLTDVQTSPHKPEAHCIGFIWK